MNKTYTKIFVTMLGSIALVVSASFTLAQAPEAFTFSTDLSVGSTGQDVIELQSFLEAQGFLVLSVGIDKGYFGSLTRDALAKYQESAHIAPAYGYFGQVTRKIVNEGLTANGKVNSNSNSGSN